MAIDYKDLEVELSRCCCGRKEVRVLESPVDRPREQLHIGETELISLQEQIDEYSSSLLVANRESQSRTRKLAELIGKELFEILTPGNVGTSLREALLLLDRDREEENAGRRLRFSFGKSDNYDPVLANLPWELIHDPNSGGRFLGCEPQTQVVRHLDVTRKIRPLAVRSPLKLLAILASPKDQSPIKLEAQESLLKRVTQEHSKTLDLHVLRPPSLQAVRTVLSQHEADGQPFHVLHFLGHGEFTADGDGALYFEKDDRSQHVVRGQVLGAQISSFRDLRLVVLTTCSGAQLPRHSGQNPFTGSASALIAANIPAVVAMQFNVSEEAAAAFTSAFYSKIGAFCPVDEAVAEGRLSISAMNADGFEWATPVLFMRSPNGNIFSQVPDHAIRPALNDSGAPRTKLQDRFRAPPKTTLSSTAKKYLHLAY